jgi:hypothetical protein
METLEALARARADHPESFEAGSVEERQALDRFTAFFSSFAADRIERLLESTYADDVWFDDTLKTVRGRPALAEYLRESAAAVSDCRVTVEDRTRTEAGEYLVRWKMMIRFRRLRRGIATWSVGVSHLRFDAQGRVVYHQDYWNAADGLYQHVPLLGLLIRAVKRRL